jgi:galactokinase
VLRSDKFRLKFPQYVSDSTDTCPPIPGIHINNQRTTLPMKKGLSSSAAVCVLVASAFDRLYDLQLSPPEIMELAYQGEMNTPSQCGRMDQCVVMGSGSVGVMQFDNTSCTLRRLQCVSPLYFVVVDLRASKDTVVILKELNECFPFADNATQVGQSA